MRMKAYRTLGVLVALASVSPGTCQLSTSMLMAYSFQPGARAESHISAKVLSLNMGGGIPVAVQGGAQVDITVEVLEVDAEGVAALRLSFGTLTAQLMGDKTEKDDLEPVTIKVDQRGSVVGAERTDPVELDLFAGGGLPVPVITMLGATIELPEQPVPVGENWVTTRTSPIPDLGEVKLTTTSRLESIDTERAVIATTIDAQLPDFTTDNPLQEGKIDVKNPNLAVENMTRTLSVETGLVETATADLTFSCTANIPGMGELPLTLTTSFELKPKGEQAEARATPSGGRYATALLPQPTAQPGAATTYQQVTRTVAQYLGAALSRGVAWWQGR